MLIKAALQLVLEAFSGSAFVRPSLHSPQLHVTSIQSSSSKTPSHPSQPSHPIICYEHPVFLVKDAITSITVPYVICGQVQSYRHQCPAELPRHERGWSDSVPCLFLHITARVPLCCPSDTRLPACRTLWTCVGLRIPPLHTANSPEPVTGA